MYFDLQDYRPDIPRIPTVISVREGVLLSIVVHLLLVIAYLLLPESFFEPEDAAEVVAAQLERPREPPLRFIEAVPLVDLVEQPVRPADRSDQDRRSRTVERPPDAIDPLPFMRGNTPEMIEGGPSTKAAGPAAEPGPPVDEPIAQVADASPAIIREDGFMPVPQPTPKPSARPLGDALRNLQQYLRQENFDNQMGGNTDQSASIQFDSMGVDFGPWLRRFKNQVERNWIIPTAAMTFSGRVVLQFNVLRNGTITDIQVLQPASLPALTNASVNAIRLSNPTAALPPEYPADKVLFTVTFHYNDPEFRR